MNIVVTGGCGFVGANLVRLLTDVPNQSVTVFDNLSRGSKGFLPFKDNLRVVEGDIRDEDALRNTLVDGDVLVHLAAYGSVVESIEDPVQNYSVNVEGTFHVLKAARDAGIRKVIFASTGGALIGNATPPVNEDSVPRPISPYGASKLAGEGYCSAFSHSYGMDILALRFANVVGPISAHKKGAVTQFIYALEQGDPIRIFGDGSATRDFLFVEDLCRGISAGLASDLTGFHVLHLASGREVSILELARTLIRVAGKENHPIEFLPKRTGEVERNFATYDRARAILGFEPRYDIEDALRTTWKWFEAR
jgi:UDP-glucose 4-epimerase